jgi:hypothetical protein
MSSIIVLSEAMPKLTPELVEFLDSGLAHQLGACNAQAEPFVVRSLAAAVDSEGAVSVLLSALASPEALDAIRDTRQVAVVLCQPSTLRTIQLKGADATVESAETPEWRALTARRGEAFWRDLAPLGFSSELLGGWYDVPPGELVRVRFTVSGAWDQTPGPGAGGPVDLLS